MNDEYLSMAMSAVSHAATMVQHGILQTFSEYGAPSAIYRQKVFLDGDKWCVLYGDNLQDGVAGFGDSPAAAIWNFNEILNGRMPNV